MKPAIPPVCIGTYRSLLWKLIPVSSIPFPYIFFRQRRSQWSDSASSYAEKENRFITRYEPVFLFCISRISDVILGFVFRLEREGLKNTIADMEKIRTGAVALSVEIHGEDGLDMAGIWRHDNDAIR